MNGKLKLIWDISIKQAVNAILTNAAMTIFFPQFMQWHTSTWWYNVGKVALGAVLAREGLVWMPQILAWTQSPSVEKAVAKAEASQAIADRDAARVIEVAAAQNEKNQQTKP